jgi:hypothetical protein
MLLILLLKASYLCLQVKHLYTRSIKEEYVELFFRMNLIKYIVICGFADLRNIFIKQEAKCWHMLLRSTDGSAPVIPLK